MSWKNLFVESDETAPPASATPVVTGTAGTVSVSRLPSAARIAVDQSIVDRLKTAVDQSTSPGYPEFMRMLEAMKDEEADERKRYRLAIKALAASGITLSKIQQSLADRLRILDRESSKFAQNLQNQLTKQVGGVQAELETTQEGIKSKEAQLAHLQEEIAELRNCESTLQSKIETEREQLDGVRVSFEAACDVVRGSLISDQETISANLKGVK